MPAASAQPLKQELMSLVDLNFFLVNKMFVLVVVLLFFLGLFVVRRIQGKELPKSADAAIKLSVLGLILLYFETTLTGYPNYRAILGKIQGVIVLVCLAKLLICIIVDFVLSIRRHGDVPMLLQDAIRLAVYLIAGVASLRLVFQVDLSAVITTTTVLTAAIAFAMQTTLSNAFYGFSVQIDPIMARGNWISLPEKNMFGQIVNVGFRYVTLKTIDNNMVLVPNTIIVQSVVKTHGNSLEAAMEGAALTIDIGLPYELPPEQARKILLSVMAEEPLVLDDPPPLARLLVLADSSMNYRLSFWIADPVQNNMVIDAVHTKVWYALNRAGWGFPYPHRQIVSTPVKSSFPEQQKTLIEGIHNSHLFDVLSEEEIKHLTESAEIKFFAPGEAAVRQGEDGSSLFFVLDGEMAVDVGGHQVALLVKGRMFGEMSLLTGEPRSATVKAVSEAQLAEIRKEHIAVLFEENERLLEKLGESLNRHQEAIKLHKAGLVSASSQEPVVAADCIRKIRSFFLGGKRTNA